MDRYKIVPKDDELYHWKYIKREKRPNGKWRYIYERQKRVVAREIGKGLGEDERFVRDAHLANLQKLTGASDPEVAKLRAAAMRVNADSKHGSLDPDLIRKGYEAYEVAVKYERAADAYDKTVYGRIDKAKKFVSQLLKK